MQPIAATFTLPQDQLPQVTKAMAAGPVETLAYAGDDKTLLDKGTLLTPDNSIDTTTGTIKLKARFPNPSNTLWPGQFVNVRVLVSAAEERRHGADAWRCSTDLPASTPMWSSPIRRWRART